MLVVIILICMDISWHIWEYRERKRLDRCWKDLFNDKLESDQRWIDFFSKITQNKGNKIEQKMLAELERKLNTIMDAAIETVNELKGK